MTEAPIVASSRGVANSLIHSGVTDIHWRVKLISVVRSIILAAMIVAAAGYGVFRPLDDWLLGARFSLLDRPPTGTVAFLEIDAASLKKVGVWPWPRTIHAAIVDRLSELGAKSIDFDVDFSAASTPENDAAFAAALKRAGGFAVLGAFEQPAGASTDMVVNTPIAELTQASGVVAVDVPMGEGNVVRDYPTSRVVGGQSIPSLAAMLGGTDHPAIANRNGLFGLNFAINLKAIDRISAADLVDGKVSVERIRGRDIVIGASAEELRDFFPTPRFGMVPGALVHVLAAETLLQGLAMVDAPWYFVAGLIIALGLLAGLVGHRLSGRRWLLAAAALAATVEFGAFWLQQTQALRITSAPIHVAILTFIIAGVVSDLRLRRRLHTQAASEREFVRAMLRQVIADDFDAVVIIDESGKILANSHLALEFMTQNPSVADMPALPPVLAKVVHDCLANKTSGQSKAPTSGELAMPVVGRGIRYLDYVVTMSSIDDKDSRRVACLTFRDITQRRAEQDQLTFLARHDPPTGAWLRHWLIWNMDTKLAHTAPGESMGLILVELRRFGTITSLFGDTTGDLLLKSVLARLRAQGHDMVARVGDANFAIAVMNSRGQFSAPDVCQLLVEQLVQPYSVGGRKITLGVDLGVAVASGCTDKAETLLAQARIAQAAARAGAVNSYKIFSLSMEAEFTEREWIETALRQALTKEQFSLDYQPQIDLASGHIIGAEALLRWHHPERGLISPAKFITIAEESGLIVDIGRWVIQTACQEAAQWPEHVAVAVNLSPLQFESSELVADVRAALKLSGLAPHRLTLEITESVFVTGGVETTALLDALRTYGVGIALDDFGTGYSSLNYLDRIPFDKLKIDQSFIKRILDDSSATAIVEAVLLLSGKLNKTVVAEGIETAEQALLLKKLGCQTAQGYYFGRPMDAVQFRKLCIEKYLDANLLELVTQLRTVQPIAPSTKNQADVLQLGRLVAE